MADLVLRLAKGSPLTDAEMDGNFTNLNQDIFLSAKNSTPWLASTAFLRGEILSVSNRLYLVTTGGTSGNAAPTHTTGSLANGTLVLQVTQAVHYSAKDVLDKLKTIDGNGSGLDADVVRGLPPSSILPIDSDKSSIASRDADGNVTFNIINANQFNGTVSTATNVNGGTGVITSLTVNGASVLGANGGNTTTILSQLILNTSAGSNGQILTSRGINVSPQWTSLPTTVTTANDNTNTTRYITFVAAAGSQNLLIDNASTPLTYNPSINTIGAIASGNPVFGSNTFTGPQTVPDEAYSISWNNNFTTPTKHSVRSAIENIQTKFTGIVFDWSGSTPPLGAMALPLLPTNVSRATYAGVFAAIGTQWGNGDGTTTFGFPYCRESYAILAANGNVGTETTGQNIAHIHGFVGARAYSVSLNDIVLTGLSPNNASQGSAQNPVTASEGGAINMAAGVRMLKCIWL